MKPLELFVDDTEWDKNNGYTLICETPYEITSAVETAVKNGFKDIRIYEPDEDNLKEYYKINQPNYEGVELKC